MKKIILYFDDTDNKVPISAKLFHNGIEHFTCDIREFAKGFNLFTLVLSRSTLVSVPMNHLLIEGNDELVENGIYTTTEHLYKDIVISCETDNISHFTYIEIKLK